MAGFGTKGRVPGSRNTPVHGAVDRAGAFIGNIESNVRGGIGNVERGIAGAVGGVEQGARSGIESGASGLRDVGHSIFGAQTAIGGLFGGGSESAATPASPLPSRAAQGPTASKMVSAPTASARPLVVAPMKIATGANKTGNATKKRRKKKGN